MKLVIENAAPLGPAHTVTFDGRSYPVLGCTPSDGGMTETYDLIDEPVPTVEGLLAFRRFTFTGRPGGGGCQFPDGTVAVNTYSSVPFEAYIHIAAFLADRPDARITWLDPETA